MLPKRGNRFTGPRRGRVADIVALYEKGLSTRQIAASTGLSSKLDVKTKQAIQKEYRGK